MFYDEAVNQMISTVDAIKNLSIKVSNMYHQKVELNSRNEIFSLIVFDNNRIKNYKKLVIINDVYINIMSINDYNDMMNVIMLSYDIFNYLQERSKWLSNNSSLPNVIIDENISSTTISIIKNESDFSNFFKKYKYDGDEKNRNDALKILSLINYYRGSLTKKGINRQEYRKILSIL